MSRFIKRIKFRQSKIRTQLLIAFTLLSVVILLISASGLFFTNRVGGGDAPISVEIRGAGVAG